MKKKKLFNLVKCLPMSITTNSVQKVKEIMKKLILNAVAEEVLKDFLLCINLQFLKIQSKNKI